MLLFESAVYVYGYLILVRPVSVCVLVFFWYGYLQFRLVLFGICLE